MKKNYFVYYATEENAFETEKNGAYTEKEAVDVVKEYLDEYMPSEQIKEAMDNVHQYKEEGTNIIFEDKDKGYTMLVGIAPKGKLREITSEISALRKEMLEQF